MIEMRVFFRFDIWQDVWNCLGQIIVVISIVGLHVKVTEKAGRIHSPPSKTRLEVSLASPYDTSPPGNATTNN